MPKESRHKSSGSASADLLLKITLLILLLSTVAFTLDLFSPDEEALQVASAQETLASQCTPAHDGSNFWLKNLFFCGQDKSEE